MEPVIELDNVRVFHGDCRDVLAALPDNSVDSIVTDPPYELGFMGKSWDASGIAYDSDVWGQCLRVLKPGGHLLAFGGTRTWHRLAVAVEDAGFEVRDSIAWMYGQGFPKSLDVSKAIDKSLGGEREKIRTRITPRSSAGKGATNHDLDPRPWLTKAQERGFHEHAGSEPVTPEGQKWQGWGTALKPAFEPIVVARKPLSGTVAETVLEWGTGGLNIDGSRIGSEKRDISGMKSLGVMHDDNWKAKEIQVKAVQGRWPANVILDEVTAGLMDEQSGVSKSVIAKMGAGLVEGIGSKGLSKNAENFESVRGHNDTGGASRFFYCAKASKRDRNEGLEDLESKLPAFGNEKGDGLGRGISNTRQDMPRQNFHPTVKPTALMRYLVKLVTPPGGTVLDPFTGSGSTGKAAILEGFDFVGVELTDDYLPIIEGRLKWALENQDEGTLF